MKVNDPIGCNPNDERLADHSLSPFWAVHFHAGAIREKLIINSKLS